MTEAGLSEMLSTGEAGRRLGLSRERVHQFLKSGELPCVKTSLGFLISAEAVDALRERRMENPPRNRRAAAD